MRQIINIAVLLLFLASCNHLVSKERKVSAVPPQLSGQWQAVTDAAISPAIIFLNDSVLALTSTGDTIVHYHYYISNDSLHMDDRAGHIYADKIIALSDTMLTLSSLEIDTQQLTYHKMPVAH